MSYESLSISLYMIMISVGYYTYKKSTANLSEDMLGGRSLSLLVTKISVGVSDMSNWLLMDFPGAIYVSGLPAMWISVGLIGTYFNYLLVVLRLLVYTELASNSITIPDFFQKSLSKLRSMVAFDIGFYYFLFFYSLYLFRYGSGRHPLRISLWIELPYGFVFNSRCGSFFTLS